MTDRRTIFRIRDALPEELDVVSRLIRASYEEYEPHYPSERWPGYINNVGDVYRRRDDGSELIVAEQDGVLVGSVTFYADGSLSGQGQWPAGWAGILRLAVPPERRGLGIGRALVEECLRRSRERGVKAVALHSTEWMAVARGLYERIGFRRAESFDFRPRPGVVGMGFKLDL